MQNGLKNLLIVAGGAAALAAPAFGQAAATSNQRWDVRYVVERYFDASEGGGLASTEVWETRFRVDPEGTGTPAWTALTLISSSGSASKQNIGRVDVTLQGRLAIVGQNSANPGDSTRPTAQRNYGINRLGGAGSASGTGSNFFLRFTDPSTYTQAGLSAANIGRGLTGETRSGNPILDVAGAAADPAGYTGGNPIAGTFAPFRVGFTPLGADFAQGSNFDSNNGVFNNPGTLAPVVAANLTGSRSSGFGLDGTTTTLGVGLLDATGNAIGSGAFANFYRLTYTPKADYSNVDSQVYRAITVNVGAQSTRYLYQRNTSTTYSQGNGPNIPAQAFTFFVPTPGTASLLGLAALAGLRRRR